MFGGTGSESISLDMPDFYPDALEAGTLAFPAISSLLEGAGYLSGRGESIGKELLSMTEYFLDGLKKLSSFRAYSVPNPCGIAAFGHRDVQSEISRAGTLGELFRRRPRRTALRAFNAQGAQNGGGRTRESELFSFQSQKGNRRTPFRPEKNELTFRRMLSVGFRFFSAFRPRISIYGAVRRPEAAKIVRKKRLFPHWKASPRACFFPLR